MRELRKAVFGIEIGDGIEFPWFAAIHGDELLMTDNGGEGESIQVYNLRCQHTSWTVDDLPESIGCAWDVSMQYRCRHSSTLVRQWGDDSLNGLRHWTQGIAVHDNEVFVVHTGPADDEWDEDLRTPLCGIAVYTLAGVLLRSWRVWFGDHIVNGVALAAINGEIFVTNPRFHRVQVYDRLGVELRTIYGEYGETDWDSDDGFHHPVHEAGRTFEPLSAPSGVCAFHGWVCVSSRHLDGVYVYIFWPDGRLVRRIRICADESPFCLLSADDEHLYASCGGRKDAEDRVIVLALEASTVEPRRPSLRVM